MVSPTLKGKIAALREREAVDVDGRCHVQRTSPAGDEDRLLLHDRRTGQQSIGTLDQVCGWIDERASVGSWTPPPPIVDKKGRFR